LGDSYEGTLKNNYLYNDKELFDDADLNWYDYGFRNYDPQIGRFPQLDPLTDSYPFLTPFQYASCDPITNIDVDGLEGCPSVCGMTGYVGNVGRAAGGGSSIGSIFNGISAVARIAGPAASIANLAVNIIRTTSQQSIVKQQLATISINGGFTTEQAGDVGHGPNNLINTDGDDNTDIYIEPDPVVRRKSYGPWKSSDITTVKDAYLERDVKKIIVTETLITVTAEKVTYRSRVTGKEYTILERTSKKIVTTVVIEQVSIPVFPNRPELGGNWDFDVTSVTQTQTTTTQSKTVTDAFLKKTGESSIRIKYQKSNLQGDLKNEVDRRIKYRKSPNLTTEYKKFIWQEMSGKGKKKQKDGGTGTDR
jgi:RHS repeat-associated protein